MTDNIELIEAIHVEQLYMTLLATIERLRAEIASDAILAEIEQPTEIGAFSVEALEAILAPHREPDAAYLDDGLGGFFAAVVALAAAAVGHSGSSRDSTMLAERDLQLALMRTRFLADTAQAVRGTIQRMRTGVGDMASRVRQVRRSIGLSPGQAASLDAARQALFAYLADPATAAPRAILSRLSARLSGPQRAMLEKAMRPELDAARVEKLLSKHANSMATYRARSTAQHQTHAFAEQGKLTAWRIAERFGILPRGQRRFWQTAGDERVRHSHAAVQGMNRAGVPLDKPFATPLGECMTPPLEIGCRCKAMLRPSL
ncbi:hypothetical protein H5J25_09605 [Sphingomonas aliaeris]|uniref:Phage head morphogenesis domain-containing protein n=1 Tax=Sphingomonas aliaeris TaxID=2759526 RepID=A0A974NS10_9SPHN|nr:phage minor head protein [Sphingomonas aliaeris]QQV75872.1 hypothetical protein H5J25_09605 [Sphingomonas aliaeris]